jgi:glycosyltransferase involved in cell wall biosynthesis
MIGDALRSVLTQSVAPTRVIVVDDGSTDGTAEEVRAFAAVELVTQKNAGPGSATTRGFAMVTTPFIATLDADDIWVQGKMERQFAVLESDPRLAGVFGRMANFKGDPASALFDQAYDGWSRTTMLIKTGVAQATGAIIDPVGSGDMVDWLARVREAGHVLTMVPEVLALRRVHAASMTYRDHRDLAKGYLQVAREAMLRKRARDGDKT